MEAPEIVQFLICKQLLGTVLPLAGDASNFPDWVLGRVEAKKNGEHFGIVIGKMLLISFF